VPPLPACSNAGAAEFLSGGMLSRHLFESRIDPAASRDDLGGMLN